MHELILPIAIFGGAICLTLLGIWNQLSNNKPNEWRRGDGASLADVMREKNDLGKRLHRLSEEIIALRNALFDSQDEVVRLREEIEFWKNLRADHRCKDGNHIYEWSKRKCVRCGEDKP